MAASTGMATTPRGLSYFDAARDEDDARQKLRSRCPHVPRREFLGLCRSDAGLNVFRVATHVFLSNDCKHLTLSTLFFFLFFICLHTHPSHHHSLVRANIVCPRLSISSMRITCGVPHACSRSQAVKFLNGRLCLPSQLIIPPAFVILNFTSE